jgi:hypothetical protein
MNGFLIGFALLAGTAQGDRDRTQWVHVQEGESGARSYYDPASVRRDQDKVRLRLRAVPGRSSTTGTREYVALEEIDCAARTAATLELTATLRNGRRQTVPMPGKAEPINPGTVVAALYDLVCAPPATTS